MKMNEQRATSRHGSMNVSHNEKISCTMTIPTLFCNACWAHFSCFCCRSVQRSNCYLVCGGDAVGPSSSSRSNSDLEIGCLIDLASGLVSFTANGKELSTTYQVKKEKWHSSGAQRGQTHKDSLPRKLQYVHAIISSSCGKYTVLWFTTAQHSLTITSRH